MLINSHVHDHRGGSIICGDCGLVLQDSVIDETAEWRDFEDSVSKSRTGGVSNPFLHSTTSSSTAGGNNSFGISRTIKYTSTNSVDRLLVRMHSFLRRGIDSLALSDLVLSRCYEVARLLDDNGYLKGKVTPVWALTLIYEACRFEGSGRSLKEIVNSHVPTLKGEQKISEALLARRYWDLEKILQKIRSQQTLKSQNSEDKNSNEKLNDVVMSADGGTAAVESPRGDFAVVAKDESPSRSPALEGRLAGSTNEFITRVCSRLHLSRLEAPALRVATFSARYGLTVATHIHETAAAAIIAVAYAAGGNTASTPSNSCVQTRPLSQRDADLMDFRVPTVDEISTAAVVTCDPHVVNARYNAIRAYLPKLLPPGFVIQLRGGLDSLPLRIH